MKTVVVTGASGFVARWVINEMLAHGYAVRGSLRSMAKADEVRQSVLVGAAKDKDENLSFFAADLTSLDGWDKGMTGADGVIHVASPLGHGTETADEMTAIAKGGVLNVFTAAHQAGIKRIVMTSSGAATTPEASVGAMTVTEDFWTDLNNPELDAYRISKVQAERAAWEFAKENDMQLSTVLPGAIYGPILSKRAMSSDAMLSRMLQGWTVVPKIPLDVSDVRDLATLHRLAFENDAAIGHRYLGAAQHTTLVDVARLYRSHYPDRHIHVVALPNWVTRVASRFVPALVTLVPMLKRKYRLSSAAAKLDLNWHQRPVSETMLDAAQSILDNER